MLFAASAIRLLCLQIKCVMPVLRQCLLDWYRSTMASCAISFHFFLYISIRFERCVRLTKESVAKNDFRQVVVASNRTKLGNDTSECTLGILRKWVERSKCWVLFFLVGWLVDCVVAVAVAAVFVCVFVEFVCWSFRYRLDQFNFWPFARAYAIHFTLNRHTLSPLFPFFTASQHSFFQYSI